MKLARLVVAGGLALPGLWLGCSTVTGNHQDTEDACTWVADPNNCYRAFRAGMDGTGIDCAMPGNPTPVDPADTAPFDGTANGEFLSHQLDVCYIAGGGQVVFDPPLSTTSATYTMTFENPDGSTCGSATFTNQRSFSFTVDAPTHSTYAQEAVSSGDTLDVTCPGGDVHEIDLRGINGQPTSQCPSVQQLVPRASLDISPDTPGPLTAVSFSIAWPPADGSPQPRIVTYFTCTMPLEWDCADEVLNGTETDVDCGGPERAAGCPARCGSGQMCNTDCDCDPALVCLAQHCTATDAGVPPRNCSIFDICQDSKKDGQETDVDCGGGDCPPCLALKKCNVDTDCMTHWCANGTCVFPDCGDAIQNGSETDVDCGGPCPTGCANGKKCKANSDCVSNGCVNGTCATPSCTDGTQDGSETDVDCGGSACPGCAAGKGCVSDDDCATKIDGGSTCINHFCQQ